MAPTYGTDAVKSSCTHTRTDWAGAVVLSVCHTVWARIPFLHVHEVQTRAGTMAMMGQKPLVFDWSSSGCTCSPSDKQNIVNALSPRPILLQPHQTQYSQLARTLDHHLMRSMFRSPARSVDPRAQNGTRTHLWRDKNTSVAPPHK